jgi:hypothetical protein
MYQAILTWGSTGQKDKVINETQRLLQAVLKLKRAGKAFGGLGVTVAQANRSFGDFAKAVGRLAPNGPNCRCASPYTEVKPPFDWELEIDLNIDEDALRREVAEELKALRPTQDVVDSNGRAEEEE